jgi:hypothetical protein
VGGAAFLPRGILRKYKRLDGKIGRTQIMKPGQFAKKKISLPCEPTLTGCAGDIEA